MSDLLPSPESVVLLVQDFERELAAATSARDAQSVRDRYLGRKNSVVSSWMQMIGAAPADQKKSIGRFANDLKQAIEARWAQHAETARDAAPAGGVDVTLPGRRPVLGHRHPRPVPRRSAGPGASPRSGTWMPSRQCVRQRRIHDLRVCSLRLKPGQSGLFKGPA